MFQVDGEDPDLSGALSSVLWELSLLRQHAHPGVVKLAAEISNMSTSSSTSALLATLSPVDALKLYSTRQGGFRPAPALPPKVVKKNAYKDPRDISDPRLLDLLGKEDLLLLEEVNDVSNSLVKHFRVLRDYLENDQLRKEHRRVSASLELYKQYMTSKPSKSKNRTTKRSKITK
jgi:nucleolar complex protein 3